MTLPAPLQFIIAMFAYALNARMARKMDYLQEEVRVLKEALAAATGKTRIELNADQRRRLALKGKQLTAEERRACCQIVRRRRSSPGFATWRKEVRQLQGPQRGPARQRLARERVDAILSRAFSNGYEPRLLSLT